MNDTSHQSNSDDAEVVTILCSVREYECLEFDSTSPFSRGEQVWIDDYKPIAWDTNGVMATTHSLDGCTDETLKIRFSPPSVLLINSPVLPISARCKKIDGFWDRLMASQPSGLAAETEQYELVPTRGDIPFQDWVTEKAPIPAGEKNPCHAHVQSNSGTSNNPTTREQR